MYYINIVIWKKLVPVISCIQEKRAQIFYIPGGTFYFTWCFLVSYSNMKFAWRLIWWKYWFVYWVYPETKVYKSLIWYCFRISIIEKDNDKLQQQLQDLRSKRQRREELEREVAEPPKRELKKDRRLIPGSVFYRN